MKKYWKRILAELLGIVLLSAWMWTGGEEISEEDKRIYKEALGMQGQVDELGFRNFYLADYPVAMYDGTRDYVFYDGQIKKRASVLETFVGTAYPVEDHFEVIVPTLEQFDGLMSLAGGVESMISGSGYGAKEQTATIWHEAFHAYQLTDYSILGEKVTPEEMRKDMEGKEQTDHESEEEKDRNKDGSERSEEDRKQDGGERSDEEWIVKEVDEEADIKDGLEKEMQLLRRAVDMILSEGEGSSDIDELQDIILEYRELRRQRFEKMPEAAKNAEIRCELTEGTAYYVEAFVYQRLSEEKSFEERYLDTLDTYEGGRGKYYRTGLAKCLLLDYLDPDWKETFDFTKELDEMLGGSVK